MADPPIQASPRTARVTATTAILQNDPSQPHRLRVSLLGPFHATSAPAGALVSEGERVQRLLAYLLLHRGRPQSRDAVGRLLWASASPDQQRKGLRQALWKLQSTVLGPGNGALTADPEYLLVDSGSDLWLDLSEFEAAYAATSGVRGAAMDEGAAERLSRADLLVRGELLQGWSDGWCQAERRRLAGLHLAMLNKLSAWCAATGRLEQGLSIGRRALAQDPVNERAHRHLMRLLALAGDRDGAMTQFGLCADTLLQAFGVQPEQRTRVLFAAIRAGEDFMAASGQSERQSKPVTLDDPQAPDLAAELRQIRDRLDALHLDGGAEGAEEA